MGFSFQTEGNLFKVFLLLEGSNQFFIIIGSHLIDFFYVTSTQEKLLSQASLFFVFV